MARPGGSTEEGGGIASFRRSGRVTEVLFLYEIALRRHSRLRPIARELGITVQAASHLHRALSRRGLVHLVEGTYLPTVGGTAFLHAALTSLRSDLDERLSRLRVVGRCRVVALRAIGAGDRVLLTMEGGVLVARPGRGGASRGRAVHAAAPGELLEVEALEGILPLRAEPVHCLVLPTRSSGDSPLARELVRRMRRRRYGILAADGLEAGHLMQRSTSLPVVRFGVPSVCREAAQMGVPVLVLVTEERLPGFLQRLSDPTPVVEVQVETLRGP